MHGGGKIIFKIGPFYFIKQGLIRGIVYAGIVLELFFMSFLLTEGFSELEDIATLRNFKIKKEKKSENGDRIDIIMLIFYVLKLFKISYVNVSVFFGKKNGNIKKGLKERVINFLVNSLKESQKEINIVKNVNIPKVKFKFTDALFISFQIIIILVAFILKNRLSIEF